MTKPLNDIVTELDAWLGAWEGPDDYRLTVRRARDEIVALRATKVLPGWTDALRQTRDEALEAAARECEARFCDGCADAIRALKDKPPG